MSEAAQRSPGYRAVDVVRDHADRDAIAVQAAPAGLNAVARMEMYVAPSGQLRSTISIIEPSKRSASASSVPAPPACAATSRRLLPAQATS